MKAFALVVLGLVVPMASQAADTLSNDELRAVVGEVSKESNILGLMMFCEKDGLQKAIGSQLMGGIILSIKEPKREIHQAKSFQAFRAAELYAEGVAKGLAMTAMDDARKARTCETAVDLADEVLANPPTPRP